MKILIAEDDPTSAKLLAKALESAGYHVVSTADGVQAMAAMRAQRFDAVLTDWMMPNMDGISLIRRVRAEFESPPPMLVITALSSADARQHAIEAGADDYLAKPYRPQEILKRLSDCIERANQPMPNPSNPTRVHTPDRLPDHVGVGIAASTGGPEALRDLVPELPTDANAAYFVVLHGPDWMLQTFAERAQSLTSMEAVLARDADAVRPGVLYICPGDRHLVVDPAGPSTRLTLDPPENFVRPAADPLFRSIAATYGPRSVAVVLTGMGRDGSLGAQQVHAVGGRVVIQDPATAIAASMPRSTLNLGVVDSIVQLYEMSGTISRSIGHVAHAVAPAPA